MVISDFWRPILDKNKHFLSKIDKILTKILIFDPLDFHEIQSKFHLMAKAKTFDL